MRSLFLQARMARSAWLFLDGLLGPERRKTGWMRAESAGDPGPWRQQAILGRGRWDAEALRDVVREYALERVKRLVRPGLGFGSFWTARRTLAGYEVMAMVRKGQVRRIGGRDMRAQATFVAELFDVAA